MSEKPTLNGADIDIIRALVKTAVDDAIHPGGMTNPHEHRRVEMTEESGKHWRGILYAVEPETLVASVVGVCWACNKPGSDLIWYGHHVIHAECREAAEQKPETKEHRG